jgi:hypothetical protein
LSRIEQKLQFAFKTYDYYKCPSVGNHPVLDHLRNKYRQLDAKSQTLSLQKVFAKLEKYLSRLNHYQWMEKEESLKQGCRSLTDEIKNCKRDLLIRLPHQEVLSRERKTVDASLVYTRSFCFTYHLLKDQLTANYYSGLEGANEGTLHFSLDMAEMSMERNLKMIEQHPPVGFDGHLSHARANGGFTITNLQEIPDRRGSEPVTGPGIDKMIKDLLALQKEQELKQIAAVVEMNQVPFGLVFNPDNTVLFVSPTGDDQTSGAPYFVHFANSQSASQELTKFLAKTFEHFPNQMDYFPLGCSNELSAVKNNKEKEKQDAAFRACLEPMAGLQNSPPAPEASRFSEAYADVEKERALLKRMIGLLERDSYDNILLAFMDLFGKTSGSIQTSIYAQMSRIFPTNQEKGQPGKRPFHVVKVTGLEDGARKRALQCVVAQLLLEGIKIALDRKEFSHLPEYLNELEGLKLDSRDMPDEMKNIAHALFATLYHVYLGAWNNNQRMIHPHDPRFRNDFGRNVFTGVVPIEDPSILSKALKEVTNKLNVHLNVHPKEALH